MLLNLINTFAEENIENITLHTFLSQVVPILFLKRLVEFMNTD